MLTDQCLIIARRVARKQRCIYCGSGPFISIPPVFRPSVYSALNRNSNRFFCILIFVTSSMYCRRDVQKASSLEQSHRQCLRVGFRVLHLGHSEIGFSDGFWVLSIKYGTYALCKSFNCFPPYFTCHNLSDSEVPS